MKRSTLVRYSLFVAPFGFAVTLLGAYMRLSDAGLGCPDRPGGYGELTVPAEPGEAGAAFPERPLDKAEAWKQMAHRAGPLVALGYVGWLAWRALRSGEPPVRRLRAAVGLLLALQLTLGVGNVVAHLPIPVVVAHNGGATLLLLGMLALASALTPQTQGFHPGTARAKP